MRQTLNGVVWTVTGFLLVTLIANVPATLAQFQPAQSAQISQANVRAQIAAIVVQQLTREGGTAQVQVSRVTVVGDYALAHWTWGEAGGQALLNRDQDGWGILQSGGGAMDVAMLRQLGVPTDAIARGLLAE